VRAPPFSFRFVRFNEQRFEVGGGGSLKSIAACVCGYLHETRARRRRLPAQFLRPPTRAFPATQIIIIVVSKSPHRLAFSHQYFYAPPGRISRINYTGAMRLAFKSYTHTLELCCVEKLATLLRQELWNCSRKLPALIRKWKADFP